MNAVKRGLAFLLLFALVCGMLPAPMADDVDHNDEPVLTSIGHSETDSKTLSGSTRSVTLTTRVYGVEEVDLSDGIALEWSDAYTGVVASFGDYTPTAVGSSADMQVSYSLASDADPKPVYTTTYSISIAAKPFEQPEFSGTITKSALLPDTVDFSDDDFIDKYTANDGSGMAGVRITGVMPNFGVLKLGSSDYNLGDFIPVNQLDDISFAPTDSGVVNYHVNAYEVGKTDEPIGLVTLEITIDKVTPPTVKSNIAKSVNALSSVTFTASDFTSACDMNDGSLEKIEVTPTNSEYGTWYSGSTAFSEAKEFNSSAISDLKFTGSAAGTATFNWRISNGAGYSDYGTGSVTISYNVGDVTYTVNKNSKITFGSTAFDTVSSNATGARLSYVKFSLPSSGKLYYDYTSASSYGALVKTTDEYYRSTSPSLSDITYVPALGYTGTVTFNYTGYNVNGVSYTGKIVLTVQEITANTVSYTTAENEAVVFDGDHFDDVCDDAGFDTLNYIKIDALPDSSDGILYYNYTSSSSKGTAVKTSTNLYFSTTKTPYLDKVAFVPKSGFTGTVTIKYTGYDVDGLSYTGSIRITVEENDTDVDAVMFETGKGETVVFDGDKFNDVCEDEDYDTLNYIKITSSLSSSTGKLYYNYTSSSSKGSSVTTSTKLYYDHDDTPYLDKVAFVPLHRHGYAELHGLRHRRRVL